MTTDGELLAHRRAALEETRGGLPPTPSNQFFGVGPITDQIIADQQAVADTFQKLGLLPHPVTVAEAVATV